MTVAVVALMTGDWLILAVNAVTAVTEPVRSWIHAESPSALRSWIYAESPSALRSWIYAESPSALRNPAIARLGDGLWRAWIELSRSFAWISSKTGFPVLMISAAALVIGLRLARKAARILVEFALALVVLIALRKLGWGF